MILQLAKTTPYLTGQFKLNIELFFKDGKAVTGDCHVSPLCDNLGTTDSTDLPFFSYPLAVHIKKLRDLLGQNFFADSPSLQSNKILYDTTELENPVWQDTYDHSYQAGVSRMRYDRYKKQFQLLCPVWTDSVSDLLSADFVFKTRAWNTESLTTETTLEFSEDIKDSLIEYLTGLDSNLLNINLDREEVTIKGLNVSSGTVVTKDVSYYIEKLLDRERPVIETDSILCQLLPSNDMIARQLINFNFCFNLSDIVSPYIAESMQMEQWTIWCDIFTNRTRPSNQRQAIIRSQAEFCDLYTNYWSIPSFVADDTNGHFDDSKNALDYLEDYNCIDYIDTNRVTQPIFHWSLAENRNYLYNFYNGFSPLVSDGGSDALGAGGFFSQPNPYAKKYRSGSNTLGWANIFDLRSTSGAESSIQTLTSFTKLCLVQNNAYWVNGMKFFSRDQSVAPVYVNIIYVDALNFSILFNQLTGQPEANADLSEAIIYFHGDYVQNRRVSVIIDPSHESSRDNISLWSILNGHYRDHLLYGQSSDYNLAVQMFSEDLSVIFSGYCYPWTIEFNKSLYAKRVDSPSEDSKEFVYMKSDLNHSVRILRYTGNLIPMMINADSSSDYNIDFFYRVMSNQFISSDSGKKYNDLMNSGYAQKYPSIDYYPLEAKRATYYPDPEKYPVGIEMKWAKNGRVWNLPELIEVSYQEDSGATIDQEYLYNKLFAELNRMATESGSLAAEGLSLSFSSQLRGLYDSKADWEYSSDSDINHATIRLTYKLR